MQFIILVCVSVCSVCASVSVGAFGKPNYACISKCVPYAISVDKLIFLHRIPIWMVQPISSLNIEQAALKSAQAADQKTKTQRNGGPGAGQRAHCFDPFRTFASHHLALASVSQHLNMRTNLDSRVLLLNFACFVSFVFSLCFSIHSLTPLWRVRTVFSRFKYSRWQFYITIYAFVVCVYVFLLLNVLILLLSAVGFVCMSHGIRLACTSLMQIHKNSLLALFLCHIAGFRFSFNVHIEIYTQDAWYINLYRHSKYIKSTLSLTVFAVVALNRLGERVSECLADDVCCCFAYFYFHSFFSFNFYFCSAMYICESAFSCFRLHIFRVRCACACVCVIREQNHFKQMCV